MTWPSLAGGGVVKVLAGVVFVGDGLVVLCGAVASVEVGVEDVGALLVAGAVEEVVLLLDTVLEAAVVDNAVGDVLVEVRVGVPESDPPPHAASPPVRAAAATATAQRCSFMGEP